MAVVKLAYRFALDPGPAQERALRSHAGAARFAWNWGLARCQERYAAERRWYSGADLHRLWNQARPGPPPGNGWLRARSLPMLADPATACLHLVTGPALMDPHGSDHCIPRPRAARSGMTKRSGGAA